MRICSSRQGLICLLFQTCSFCPDRGRNKRVIKYCKLTRFILDIIYITLITRLYKVLCLFYQRSFLSRGKQMAMSASVIFLNSCLITQTNWNRKASKKCSHKSLFSTRINFSRQGFGLLRIRTIKHLFFGFVQQNSIISVLLTISQLM